MSDPATRATVTVVPELPPNATIKADDIKALVEAKADRLFGADRWKAIESHWGMDGGNRRLYATLDVIVLDAPDGDGAR